MTDEYDVLNILRKKNRWMTSKEIVHFLDFSKNYDEATARSCVNKKLKHLTKYGFVERKQKGDVRWGNEYIYKAIKCKEI